MPFTTEITGVYGGAQFTGSDYTDPAITQPYMNVVSDLFTIANRNTPPTDAEAQQLQADLQNIINIAKNGLSVQNEPGGKSVTYYMTSQMVDSLNTVLKSLQAGGVSNITTMTTAQLTAWQSSVQSGTLQSGLLFNTQLFNIFYYAANYFANEKVPLNTSSTATQLVAALTKSSGNVAISPYAARSLQAMTEVDYVNEGNDLINKTLTSMYDALGLTKSVLDSLATLQNVHNELTVVSRQDNQAYSREDIGAPQFQQKYESHTSTYTNNLIPQLSNEHTAWLLPGAQITYAANTVVANPANSGPNNTLVTLHLTLPFQEDGYRWTNPVTLSTGVTVQTPQLTVRVLLPISSTEFTNPPTPDILAKISNYLGYQTPSEITVISGDTGLLPAMAQGGVWPLLITQQDAQTLIQELTGAKTAFSANVAALSAAAGTDSTTSTYKSIINNPQSVYNLSKKVLQDMSSLDPSKFSTYRSWVMDNYQSFNTPDAAQAGAYQQNITAAVTAAQSTNDTQKENVRNNLFLFEEFYKSASTVLTMMNQIMTKMAQGISR